MAGWPAPPRVIPDPAELGDVPDGAVILDVLCASRAVGRPLPAPHVGRFTASPAGPHCTGVVLHLAQLG
jgi:hypothetical protein